MVGEIRDVETAKNVVQAAMTGHMVLSTIHTGEASGAIGRMLDLGVMPFLLAGAGALLLACLTVSALAIKAARSNLTEILRPE